MCSLLCGVAFLFSVPWAVSADPVDVQTPESQFSLVGGELKFNAQPVVFDTKQISSKDWKGSTVSTDIGVTDDSGRAAGWTLTVSGGDFESPELPDPTSGGKGTYVLSYPVSSVEVRIGNVYVNSGQEIDPVHGPFAKGFFLNTSPQTIFNADPGYGMGDYQISPTFALTVPKTVTVSKLQGEGSSYKIGDTVGAVATTYKNRLTYTLSTGI